jgi:hypothetical protein
LSGLTYSRTESGLLVAENASADERAVARALRDHDPDLRLVPQSRVGDRIGYSVYRYAGSDRPAEFLLFWGNTASGEPYPLSSRLLDEVKRLDRNSRGAGDYVDVDERNARAKAELREHADKQGEELFDDWRKREGRSALLPRGVSLRRARSKTGYHESL